MILSFIAATIFVYVLMTRVYKRFTIPLLLPILTSTVVLIILLTLFQIPYQTYMKGGVWINHLLGPGVVALAYPLYRERKMIKNNFLPIAGGVLIGTIMASVGGFLSAQVLGVERSLLLSFIPKSVTSPVAIDISKQIGGLPPLTVSFVMIAGILGAMIGPSLFRLLHIHHDIGKGIGYGSASHAIGTSKALQESNLAGAASSVAMIFSAILSAILIPLLIMIWN